VISRRFVMDEATHVIEAFQDRRGVDPQSGETMHGVGGPLRKLHADMSGGRSIRAVTWYDQTNDVCWLLAAGRHDDFYEGVLSLAKTNAHLPTAGNIANFQADAPTRAMERVARSARKALEAAIAAPGVEIPVTTSPPPEAYFRVDDNLLQVRITIFAQGRRLLSEKQVAGIQVGVFGKEAILVEFPPNSGVWDSVLMIGPVPSLDSWPPARLVAQGTV
jgi:hypothetical protein